MASHKTYTHNIFHRRGFTLIEIIVTVSILAIVALVSLGTNIDSYHGYSFRDERNDLVTTLEHARSQAMNNVCMGVTCIGSLPHGVHIESNRYVLFQGNIYDPTDPFNEITMANSAMTLSGLSDVVFSPFSGNATTTPVGMWEIVMRDTSGHTSTTTINSVGQISWTN